MRLRIMSFLLVCCFCVSSNSFSLASENIANIILDINVASADDAKLLIKSIMLKISPFIIGSIAGGVCGLFVYGEDDLKKAYSGSITKQMIPLLSVVSGVCVLISLVFSDKNKWMPYLLCPFTGMYLGWCQDARVSGTLKGLAISAAFIVGNYIGSWGNIQVAKN